MNIHNDINRGNSSEKNNNQFDLEGLGTPSTDDTSLGLGGVSSSDENNGAQNSSTSNAENRISNYSQAAAEAEKTDDISSSASTESTLTTNVQQEESHKPSQTVTNTETTFGARNSEEPASSVQEPVINAGTTSTPQTNAISQQSTGQEPSETVSDTLRRGSETFNKQENTTMSQDTTVVTHTPLPQDEIWLEVLDTYCQYLKYYHQGQIIRIVGQAGSLNPAEAIESLGQAKMLLDRLIKVIKKNQDS